MTLDETSTRVLTRNTRTAGSDHGGQVRLQRIYDAPALERDVRRILVDRIWPRGVSRESAALDGWPRAIAPSADLRRWFGDRWTEFRRRYLVELLHGDARPALDDLVHMATTEPVSLLYGARDPAHNHAVVLRDVLEFALAHGLPETRPDLQGAMNGLPPDDLASLTALAYAYTAGDTPANGPHDVALVAVLPAYLDGRSVGLCHDGAVELFETGLLAIERGSLTGR